MKFTTVTKQFLLLITIITLTFSCTKCDITESESGNKYLIEVKSENRTSKEEIKKILKRTFPFIDVETPIINGVIKDIDIAAITYKTVGVGGKPITASGVVLMLPGTTSYNHLVSIQHATLDMEDAPSKHSFSLEAAPVFLNKIIVMADYEGYGVSQTSDRQHPFLHIKSTGIVCADMIEAAREYLKTKNILETSSEIELVGYSQGATSSIATLFEIERRGQASRIRAVHAGGGAYDVKAIMNLLVTESFGDFADFGFIPYVIRGISYGELVTLNDNKIYAQSLIDKGITKLFSTTSISTWHNLMGGDIKNILHSDFFYPPLYNNNSDILNLISMLDKNAILKYDAPKTAVKLYHSKLDDIAPYSGSVAIKETWENATLKDLTSAGHSLAFAEFLLGYMGLSSLMPK